MQMLIAFTILIAGINAVPYSEKFSIDFSNERLVSGSIEGVIEDISQAIKDAGLDPLYIKREAINFALPVPVVFNCAAFIEEVLSTGLSHIVIHRINYSLITSRLNLDIELPLIQFSVDGSAAHATAFGRTGDVSASGKAEIVSIRIPMQMRVSVGIISGISIRSITVNFTLRDINSDINLFILGTDYSDIVNNFIGVTVPNTIKAHYNEINELLQIVLLEIINSNL